jgi:hypothetical protein
MQFRKERGGTCGNERQQNVAEMFACVAACIILLKVTIVVAKERFVWLNRTHAFSMDH